MTALALVGSGAVTAVGLTGPETCAAIRARVAGFRAADFLRGSSLLLHDLPVARVELGPISGQSALARLVSLAVPALRECLASCTDEPARVPLLLCVRDAFRNDAEEPDRAASLLESLGAELDVRFHSASAVFEDGRAGAFRALLEARALLAGGRARLCVIGGVDSFLNTRDLRRFHSTFRLLYPPISRGFIPGEAAAFVAVSAETVPGATRILGVGLAREDARCTVLSDGHPTGKGLARALAEAAKDAGVPESRIDHRRSDLNGERYYGMDAMFALARFYRTRREHLSIDHPADCVGDVGAAMGPLQLIVASTAFAKGYAPGSLAMCEGSSDEGLRAGCLLAPAPAS